MSNDDIRAAWDLVADNQENLLEKWNQIHGIQKLENLVSEEELNAQIEKAKNLALEAEAKEPRAISVSYNQSSGLVMIALKMGLFSASHLIWCRDWEKHPLRS